MASFNMEEQRRDLKMKIWKKMIVKYKERKKERIKRKKRKTERS